MENINNKHAAVLIYLLYKICECLYTSFALILFYCVNERQPINCTDQITKVYDSVLSQEVMITAERRTLQFKMHQNLLVISHTQI